VETAVRLVGVIIGVTGAAAVVPRALPQFVTRSREIFRWLFRRPHAVTVRLGTAAIFGGAGTLSITVTRGFSETATIEERFDTVKVWIDDLARSVSQLGTDLRTEIREAANVAASRAEELERNLESQAQQLEKMQLETLRINGEAIPLIIVGVILTGIPWADGSWGVAWLTLAGAVAVRFLLGLVHSLVRR
jgi:ABC-type transport system involved in cytochrome c biogenesis permease subunit